MRGTNEDCRPDREVSNIRFLVEHQFRLIDELDRRGRDARAERNLLSRLMRRHEDLRAAAAAPRAIA